MGGFCQACPRECNAVQFKELPRFRLREIGSAGLTGFYQLLSCGFRIDADRRRQWRGLQFFPVLRKVGHICQTPGGPLRRWGKQDAAVAQDLHGFEVRIGKRGVHHNRFAVLPDQFDDGPGGLFFQFPHVGGDDLLEPAEKTRDIDGMDQRLLHERLGDPADHLGVFFGGSAVVDGVAGGHAGKQTGPYLFLGGCRQHGNLEAVNLCIVGRHGVVPAAFGDYGHLPAPGKRKIRKTDGRIEHLIHIVHPYDARLFKCGIHNGIIHGQGSGVRSGRPHAGAGSADLQHDDRFPYRHVSSRPD